MKKKRNNVKNYSSLPYRRLLNLLGQEESEIVYSPIIEYKLNKLKFQSPLKMMLEFADSLQSNFIKEINNFSYKSIKKIAEARSFTIIGYPKKTLDKPEVQSSYLACQTNSILNRTIFLNSEQDLRHARETIVHEIMHTLFLDDSGLRPGNVKPDYIEEFLCEYGAVRFLLPESNLIKNFEEVDRENIAEELLRLARASYKVSEKLFSKKLFDIYFQNNPLNIEAIILWGKNDKDKLYTSDNIVPYWSVTNNVFIPWKKSKTICTAKSDGIIARSIIERNDYLVDNAREKTSIGQLEGIFNISVCAYGKKENNRRFLLSVFYS